MRRMDRSLVEHLDEPAMNLCLYRNEVCDVRGVPDVSLNVCALGNVSSLTEVAASLQHNTRPDRHFRLPVFRGCRESFV